MNPCVKTGLWYVDSDGFMRTGDLFLVAGEWWIKGVPDAIIRGAEPEQRVVKVRLRSDRYIKRPGEPWHDARVQLEACDERFRKHIDEWYPEIAAMLPEESL